MCMCRFLTQCKCAVKVVKTTACTKKIIGRGKGAEDKDGLETLEKAAQYPTVLKSLYFCSVIQPSFHRLAL